MKSIRNFREPPGLRDGVLPIYSGIDLHRAAVAQRDAARWHAERTLSNGRLRVAEWFYTIAAADDYALARRLMGITDGDQNYA